VGRLDAMTSVNARALDYYDGQEIERLPAASLERRARILHAMGEDEKSLGDYDEAERLFAEAHRTTAQLLADEPDNPDRIFAHAQSEFWNAQIPWLLKDFPVARQAAGNYYDQALRLSELEPGTERAAREVSFALNSICGVEVQAKNNSERAVDWCRQFRDSAYANLKRRPDDPDFLQSAAVGDAWYADALVNVGRLDDSLQARVSQYEKLDRLVAADPRNFDHVELRARAMMSLMEAYIRVGDAGSARKFAERARQEYLRLVTYDPDNQLWRDMADRLERKDITDQMGKNDGVSE
ncbi:MAG: hypothetical protein AAF205_02230, partial [Pseudomonadota bacterium]